MVQPDLCPSIYSPVHLPCEKRVLHGSSIKCGIMSKGLIARDLLYVLSFSCIGVVPCGVRNETGGNRRESNQVAASLL